MEPPLIDRFHMLALPPFSYFLSVTGVYHDRRDKKWKKRFLFRTRSVFFLILFIQSNVYIGLQRNPMLRNFTEFLQSIDVRSLVNAIFWFGSLVSDSVVHVALFLTVGSTISSLLENLELVDYDLKRPSLFRVNFVSLTTFIYAIFMVRA